MVNAANISYKTEYYSAIDTAIYVNGLDNNLEEGYSYYIYVTQDNTTDVDTVISNANMAHCDGLKYDSESNQFYLKVSAHNNGNFEKAGDYYAFIVKGKVTHKNTFSLIDGPTKLERPKLLANGDRITVNFTQNATSYYIRQYNYYTRMFKTDRKVKFYLGKIEDENGIYTNMDDVQAYTVNNSGILDKFSTYKAKEDSQKTSENEKDLTKASGKLPNAGIGITIISLIILAAIISIIVYNKYKKLKNI